MSERIWLTKRTEQKASAKSGCFFYALLLQQLVGFIYEQKTIIQPQWRLCVREVQVNWIKLIVLTISGRHKNS